MTAPDAPAEPQAPRLTASARSVWPDPELDPDYPDLDGLALDDEVVELPDARTLSVLRSRLVDCQLALDPDVPVELHDSVLVGVDLTGRRLTALTRVRLERCRLGGSDLGDAHLRDVVLDDCVLDLSAWRGAQVERLVVTGGRVDGWDLSGAQLQDVTLGGVALTDVTWERVRAERVDLSGADVTPVRDVTALRGCTLSAPQAVQLAARAVRALGVHVRPEG